MQLAAESRGIVYRDRLVLEKGVSSFEKAGNYQVEALSLRITPAGDNATGRVSVRKPGVVQVAALNGPVRVIAANGVVLANLQEGRTLDFTPEAPGPQASTTVTGCVERSSGKFLLTDETSLVRFEVLGASVEKEAGHRVEIAGSVTSVPESLSQIQSSSLKQLSKKCSNRGMAAAAAGTGAAGAGAAGTSGAGAAGGIGSAIASHAVIAGVIVAGAATGAAVAIVKNNDSGPAAISPSRP